MANFTPALKRKVLAEIKKRAGKAGAPIYFAALAYEVRRSIRTIHSIIKTLEDEGEITCDRHKRVNSWDKQACFFTVTRGRKAPSLGAEATSTYVEVSGSNTPAAQHDAPDASAPAKRKGARRVRKFDWNKHIAFARLVRTWVDGVIDSGADCARRAVEVLKWEVRQRGRGIDRARLRALSVALGVRSY